MKSTFFSLGLNEAQLNLFEAASTIEKKWSVQDIWSPEWNSAINLAIISTCKGNWLQLKNMRAIAIEFAVPNENYPAFAYQVKHLATTGKLLERINSKTKNSEWTAA